MHRKRAARKPRHKDAPRATWTLETKVPRRTGSGPTPCQGQWQRKNFHWAIGLYSRLKTPVPKVRTFSTSQSSLQVAGPMWNLGRLNHVAIAVPDLEKAKAFYKNVLGAQVSETVPIPEHGVSVVFVNLGNTKMELLHPLGNDSPVAAFLQKNKAGGMHHICIEVDDINAAVMDLKEKKIRSLSEEAKIGAHGKPVIFLHPKDCGGVLVELEQA
ncbi:methylmalonyl-CoA epimerase, mitochondrial isoform X2 [Halichoerus grypus]|uniref:methylmalonyl-CoA epimerase, mitochondrial isoform X2 n=1 Tax=Phoca vitulina TaxID=9720 RepID=UPI0013961402|nr:methylmalonyl-CoA epimerase, mitochondrial isoform X2 [Phoca vitulina]